MYCHPGRKEANLSLGFSNGVCKVSYDGKQPTGFWSLNHLETGTEIPSGIEETQPVLCVAFHVKGIEALQQTTVYGTVKGTTNVWRAIGCADQEGRVRIYGDREMSILERWHVVLVATFMAPIM